MSMKALTSTIIKAIAMHHVIYVEENSPPIEDYCEFEDRGLPAVRYSTRSNKRTFLV